MALFGIFIALRRMGEHSRIMARQVLDEEIAIRYLL
jgi:hypothetical protein